MIVVPYRIRWEPTPVIVTGDVLEWPVRVTFSHVELMWGRLVDARVRLADFDRLDVDVEWTGCGVGHVPDETLRDVIDDGLRAIGRARTGRPLTTVGDRHYRVAIIDGVTTVWFGHLRLATLTRELRIGWAPEAEALPPVDRRAIIRTITAHSVRSES